MNSAGTIIWKDEIVGTVTNIMFDMWYIDANWKPDHTEISSEFMAIASKLKGDEVIRDPAKGLVALLKYDEVPSNSHHVLILSADNSSIFMRSISDETAGYVNKKLLEPWQLIDNGSFYEAELRKEVSFFHPLNWKKVRAIANRKDCDEVLFEVLNGDLKYAVVHLTWRKENSRKFPATEFYKDWEDIFVNRIIEDNKEWKAHQ